MLSICIPVYNFDIRALISALEKQIGTTDIPVNLILIDDGSEEAYHKTNASAAINHQYVRLERNIGRAKIRNLFLNYTDAKYLLFLDCDVITPPNFIQTYLAVIRNTSPKVVCGGRIYPDAMADRSKLLSYRYGIYRESKPVEERKQHPNDSFMTNNFVIRSAIFRKFPFEESISGYGHEDTLLGFELKKAAIEITHIENPVINGDIETNAVYLKKTNQAIANLVQIVNSIESREAFTHSVRLLRVYFYSLNNASRAILMITFRVSKSLILRALLSGSAPIWLFDFYKLGMLGEKVSGKKHGAAL